MLDALTDEEQDAQHRKQCRPDESHFRQLPAIQSARADGFNTAPELLNDYTMLEGGLAILHHEGPHLLRNGLKPI
jgi:hypothetical protein